MRVEFEGMENFLNRMKEAQRRLKKAANDVAEEVSDEVLTIAIQKASGPNYRKQYNKERAAERRRKNKNRNLTRMLPWMKYSPNGGLRYPVPVITGTFRRAHKRRKVAHAVYEVYGDLSTANYFTHVHDGTSKMEGRPTIDDAVFEVRESGKAKEIAIKIVRDHLKGV